MTAKGRFKHSRSYVRETLSWVVALILIALSSQISCASANPQPSNAPSNDQTSDRTDVSPKSVQAELSSKRVMAGTLVLIKVALPVDLRKKPVTGEFEGIALPFYTGAELGEGVYQSLLGVPYERKPGKAAVTVWVGEGAEAKKWELPFQVVKGRYKSETLRVDGRRVNPTSKEDLARIEKEQEEVGEVYRRVTLQKFWTGPFTLPIKSPVTSPFGKRRIYNGKLKNFHTGTDLKAAEGTPVLSAAPGVVALAKNLFYTGNTVMIDHGYGVITLYAHLSELKVNPGQTLKDHDLLGLSGQTGRVTGPHLHWMAILHRVKVNPLGLTKGIQ